MIQIIIKYGRPIVLAIKKSGSTPPPILSWIWGTITGTNWGTSTPGKLWGVPESTTAPANLTAPTITGAAIVGQTLTINGGTWSAVPYILKYDIYRGATLLTSLATSNSSISYTVLQSDVGGSISCVVSAINSAGTAVAPTSNTVTIIDTIIQKSGSASAAAYDINMVLNSSYANYSTQIVRVRRSGDNAEANYGVASNGYVDWSAITTWVNAGGGTQNGFVVTIYDQSGNGRNFTQSTQSAQMQIIASGVLLTDTGAGSGAVPRAAMRSTGTQFYEVAASTAMFNFLHNGGDGWITSVQRCGNVADPAAFYGIVGNFGGSGANTGFAVGFADNSPNNNATYQAIWKGSNPQPAATLVSNVMTANQIAILNFQFDADNATLANRAINWVNNSTANANNTLNGTPVTSNATFNLQWGSNGAGGFGIVGSLQRLIIWNANLSTQRTTLTDLTNSYYGIYTPVIVSDPNAQAFVDAASITSQPQADAVNTLVIGMKAQGLWTKTPAVYPMVGGTEYSHKFNLKDPRDLDAAFRLAFSGTWIHSSTGATPNGTNAFADTFLVCSTEFNTTTFNHFSYYSRSNTAKAAEYVMGSFDGVGNTGMIIRRDNNSSLMIADYPSSTTFRAATGSVTDSRGFFLGSQTGANIKMFKNNILLASNTGATLNSAQSTRSVYIGALNSTPASFYTDKECAFASIGQGLSDAEVTSLNTLVQAFQTSLGRNV